MMGVELWAPDQQRIIFAVSIVYLFRGAMLWWHG